MEFKIKVHPNKLKGVNIFWKIILESKNNDIVAKCIDFLNKLYAQLSPELEKEVSSVRNAFITTYLQKLEEILLNQTLSAIEKETLITRLILVIKDMIDESETKGTGGLKSHSALLKGDIVIINVSNSLNIAHKNVDKKLVLHLFSNTTIWELRREIGKKTNSSSECVRILHGGKEIKDIDNGKTLAELRMKGKTAISSSKKSMEDVAKVALLTKEKKLVPKAEEIFTSWYYMFSPEGKMNSAQCAEFVRSCTNDTCKADDRRVGEVFKQFDDDKDGFLTRENFMEFYRSAVLEREGVVWSNLHSHGYRNDLKKLSELEEASIDMHLLPRYLLSKTPKSFDLFFSILDMGGKPAEQVRFQSIYCRRHGI